MLSILQDAPHPPPHSGKMSPDQVYTQHLRQFKSAVLECFEGFDRLALIAAADLNDWRQLRDEATNVEVASLYLKYVYTS